MSFLKLLQGIGDRIGILETVSAPANEPDRHVKTRIVTLHELTCEIKSLEVSALADESEEAAPPPERIFETAGIAPNPKGWSVDKLKEIIQGELDKKKPREEIQKSVLAMMNADGVTAGDIVKDAVARDRALDAFEETAQERMAAGRKRIQDIEAQIEALRREDAGLRERMEERERQWSEWKRQKRAYENDLAATIAYIVDHPVITTDNDI